jgi:hypothetical protein
MSNTDVNLKYVSYVIAPLLVTICLMSLFSAQPNIDYKDYAVTSEFFDYSVSQTISSDITENKNSEVLFLDNSYVAFKEAIAFKESQGKYAVINTLGYLGKYQFGVSTLEVLGIKNPQKFLKSPALQEKAFLANTKRNKWVLRRDIKRFVGKKIDGIRVTESGILAAAHLAGPGSVKRYLRSYGALGFADAYGTDIPSYMRKFSGYDTSFVVPDRKSKVNLFE